jgi:hypothetical protein
MAFQAGPVRVWNWEFTRYREGAFPLKIWIVILIVSNGYSKNFAGSFWTE